MSAGTTDVDLDWRGVGDDSEEVTRAAGLRLARSARRLVADLLRPRRPAVALALLILVVENAVMLTGPLLVALAVDTGVPAALDGRPAPLAWSVAGYAACGLASSGLRAAFLLLSGRIGQDVLLELRRRVFRQAQRLALEWHESYTSGRLISRLTSDLESIDDLLQQGLDGLLGALLSLAGITVLLLLIDPVLAGVVLAGFAPLALLTRWFQRRSRASYRLTRTWVARVIVQFVESMNGMRAVQAYRREARNESIMEQLNHRYRDANADALLTLSWFVACVRAVGNLTLALVLLLGALRVTSGALELGALTAFLLYLRRFYDPLDQLAQFMNAYQSAAAALEKLASVLETPIGVPEPAHPRALPVPVRGALAFDRVTFAYPRAPERVVLPEFSLTVPAGQTVALVGETGAGKTTLAKLAARFHDPVSGAVLLDGVDLRDLADADLRRALVMVTQEPFLFSGSLADNVAMGRPGASRAEIAAAVEAVGAGFAHDLPEGLDTDVRKRGGRLSAGQRQLVSLARVVLADPAVVLLDEATSSLDIPSERAVQAALETVLADRTALIIAHRLSTVAIADRVLVMGGGRIVQDGTPGELLASGGDFADLHAAWQDSLR
ncbi:ABC transporter ATP-binding protein/permease [Pseudonocardia kujensis]|uniref:ABC transporter ATP-binding protein n=1 Tax=Pseudonocardia kujensis TaxID=1128675 RepID=UPI001E370457|nr:ABC transporter ATP-binding protein [Pseudonocardia kujensis]MCE0762275.1 ABC transporter ATP-binding protein/permease [Pseudonocardia kujensis]